jgi:glycerol uptake facilitator-like aquaporin
MWFSKKNYANYEGTMANPIWPYSWIPFVGPIVGGLQAVVIFKLIT